MIACRCCCPLAGWTKSLIPRHVTDVLAADVARSVGASVSNTGLVVLLQAAMTVALGGVLFQAIGTSTIQAAKGTAAGCTAGAIGAAGLSTMILLRLPMEGWRMRLWV